MIIFNKAYIPSFKYAFQVSTGDILRTLDGMSVVVEIKKKVMKECFQLVVEKGSVIANDILVGAVYFKENDDRKIFNEVLNSAKIPIQNTH